MRFQILINPNIAENAANHSVAHTSHKKASSYQTHHFPPTPPPSTLQILPSLNISFHSSTVGTRPLHSHQPHHLIPSQDWQKRLITHHPSNPAPLVHLRLPTPHLSSALSSFTSTSPSQPPARLTLLNSSLTHRTLSSSSLIHLLMPLTRVCNSRIEQL